MSKGESIAIGERLAKLLGDPRFNIAYSSARMEILHEMAEVDNPVELANLSQEHKFSARWMLRIEHYYKRAQAMSQEAVDQEEANQRALDEDMGFR